MDKQNKLTLAIRIIIGFHIVSIIFWGVGQGGAVIDYDAVAKMGLQDARETVDPVVVVVNRGIGLADALIGVPLFILAVIGLWRRKFWGAVFSWMVFGIGFYWTAIAWCKQDFYIRAGIKSQPFNMGVHLMLAFVFLFSVWGSWYLLKNRKLFDES